MRKFAIILLIAVLFGGCDTRQQWYENQQQAYDAELLHATMKNLTDVIVYDIFSPPVAARIYSYPSIAAYEIMALENSSYRSLANQLTDFKPIPTLDPQKEYSSTLASLEAFMLVGKALIFSEEKVEAYRQEVHNKFKDMKIPSDIYENSLDYGAAVAAHVLEWADGDNYKQTRTFPKYTIQDDSASWKPTPPDYMEGIEPHWNKIRPFVIDSANQFIPEPPTKFEITPESPFFAEIMEVYEVTNNLNTEQEEIAKFWDCNPYVSHHQGHVMYATKKITPGGHWIGIAKIASQTADADFLKSAEAYALTSIALSDGFISCWDEKWRSILIRPETVINQYVDENWLPLLQTPPFPEYTSGHSVVSGAASVVLTKIFGDPFPFVDDTEVEYGLTIRSFNSFYDASAEAAISRMYGGIHYMPAINNGLTQGKQVGNYIAANLETHISQ